MLSSPLLLDRLLAIRTRWSARYDMYSELGGPADGARVTAMVIRDLDEFAEEIRVGTAGVPPLVGPGPLVGASDPLDGVPAAVAPDRDPSYHPAAGVQIASAVACLHGGDMADSKTRVKVLRAWHVTPKGCFTCSIQVGEQRALVMQRSEGGPYYLRQEVTGANRQIPQSLGTRSQEDALREAAARLTSVPGAAATEDATTPGCLPGAAQVTRPLPSSATGPLTLERLIDEYWGSVALEKNDPATRATKTSAGRILLGFFGRTKLVTDFTHEDFGRFEQARYRGGVRYLDYVTTPTGRQREVVKETDPVGKRAVQSDLILLRTMFNWARRNLKRNGVSELPENPIEGYELPEEKNPTRRVMPHERFEAIREAGKRLATSPEQPEDARLRMSMFYMAFVMTEFLGRRIGTVRQLTRGCFRFNEDRGFEGARVRFAGETNKNGEADGVPIPAWFAGMVHEYCRTMPLPPSGCLFWTHGTDRPLTTDLLEDLFDQAQRAAGLEPVPYMKWHSLRRKWATERKGLPISDVMVVGGWKDIKTFLACYQHADEETMLGVLEHPAKLHSDGWLRDAKGQRLGGSRLVLAGQS